MDNFPRLKTGYDTAAINSYAVFRQLRDEGIIAKGVKFQVCLPTATQLIGLHIQPAFQGPVEPHYEAALLRSIAEIQRQIPHEDLAIQLDLCLEYGLLNDRWWQDVFLGPIVYLPIDDKFALKNALLERIVRTVDAVDEDVELGFHMCYGDMGKRHFIQPTDTAMVVDMTLAIISQIKHSVSWIHFPVPKDRDDDAYLQPLRALINRLNPQTDIYVGLVHEYDLDGSKRRLSTATKFFNGRDFGISTECGFGRRNKEDLNSGLQIKNALWSR